MSTTCGTITTDVSCNSGRSTLSFTNEGESSQIVEVEIVPGGQILDPDGNLLYENTGGGIRKAKLRIPA